MSGTYTGAPLLGQPGRDCLLSASAVFIYRVADAAVRKPGSPSKA